MAPFQVEIKWTTAHFPALPKLTSQQGLKWGGTCVARGAPHRQAILDSLAAAPAAHLLTFSFFLSLQHCPRHSSWYKGRHC